MCKTKITYFYKLLFYSNFQERRVVRYLSSDLTVRLCSGIFHRIDTIKQAAANYNYDPYVVTKPGKYVYNNFLTYFTISYYFNSKFTLL